MHRFKVGQLVQVQEFARGYLPFGAVYKVTQIHTTLCKGVGQYTCMMGGKQYTLYDEELVAAPEEEQE